MWHFILSVNENIFPFEKLLSKFSSISTLGRGIDLAHAIRRRPGAQFAIKVVRLTASKHDVGRVAAIVPLKIPNIFRGRPDIFYKQSWPPTGMRNHDIWRIASGFKLEPRTRNSLTIEDSVLIRRNIGMRGFADLAVWFVLKGSPPGIETPSRSVPNTTSHPPLERYCPNTPNCAGKLL